MYYDTHVKVWWIIDKNFDDDNFEISVFISASLFIRKVSEDDMEHQLTQ
jgi:hypothetical protein